MDDEFALCWNNFQDNLQTGFQNLYDRGDLVDVTLACDGKLLHAHKIVLAICSPYFQEMFNTNPCKHPIIILKDVSFNVMCELLQFMYQGVVNVKHTELSSFMKIAQTLQIKGLATAASNSSLQKSPEHLSDHCPSPTNNNPNSNNSNNNISRASPGDNNSNNNLENSPSTSNNAETKPNLSQSIQNRNISNISENSSSSISSTTAAVTTTPAPGPYLKRLNEYSSDTLSVYSRKISKRVISEMSDHDHGNSNQNNDSMDQLNADDVFLPPIPHITIGESPRFDLNNVKREIFGGGSNSSGNGNLTEHPHHHHHTHHLNHPTSPGVRNSLPPPFNFELNMYAAAAAAASKGLEYPNDLHMGNDYGKGNAANHMDIPQAGSQITMLSSTSLLHGNCIFNRNNTVATQQGMKTYWLCKSYRISMCRARCITHQGRVISATGVHNHLAHMKNPNGNLPNEINSVSHQTPTTTSNTNNSTISITNVTSLNLANNQPSSMSTSITGQVQNTNSLPHPLNNQQFHITNQNNMSHHHHHHLPAHHSNSGLIQQSSHQHPQTVQQHQLQHQHSHHSPTSSNPVMQNVMQNVLTQNSNIMHHITSSQMLTCHNVPHNQHHHNPSNHQIQSSTTPPLPTPSSSSVLNNIQLSQHQSSLQITPVLSSPNVVSQSATRNQGHNEVDSPNMQQHTALESPRNYSNHNENSVSSQTHPNASSHSTIIVTNNPIESPLGEDPSNVTVNTNSHDANHSNSSSSHLISSISISPNQHTQFKIENM